MTTKRVSRKKQAVVLIAIMLFSLVALIQTGAIEMNQMSTGFRSYFQGNVDVSNMTVISWSAKMQGINPDALEVNITSVSNWSGDFYIEITILDSIGTVLSSSSRTVAFVSGTPQSQLFTFVQTDIVQDFSNILLDISH